MKDIQLLTNDELIAELLSRRTFAGIVIRQKESYKGNHSEAWRWESQNVDDVAGILNRFVDAIRLRDSEEGV